MALSFLFVIVIVMLPIAALVAGISLVVLSRRRGAPFPVCGKCKYDLTGTIGVGTRCPECGSDFAVAGIIPPSGKRNTGMLVAGLALMVVPVLVLALAVIPAFAFQTRRAVARPIPPATTTISPRPLPPVTIPPNGFTLPPSATAPDDPAAGAPLGGSQSQPDKPPAQP